MSERDEETARVLHAIQKHLEDTDQDGLAVVSTDDEEVFREALPRWDIRVSRQMPSGEYVTVIRNP